MSDTGCQKVRQCGGFAEAVWHKCIKSWASWQQRCKFREFLRFVKPETALISCGVDNSYGHPHKETLQRLKEAVQKVYRTDDGGEIMVRVWEDSYAIEVFGEQKE